MKIHKEGIKTVLYIVFLCALIDFISYLVLQNIIFIFYAIVIISLVFLFLIIWFFRDPKRDLVKNNNLIYSPADGKVVVIEKTVEKEYLKDERIQVSIFMSPLNVHINRYPVSGKIVYTKYHEGKYFVAWHPKSSTKNERATIVVETGNKTRILVRQIAGAVARRIVCYAKTGSKAEQGNEIGFIKFGSRVDIFLPTSSKILCKPNQKVKGNQTILAELE